MKSSYPMASVVCDTPRIVSSGRTDIGYSRINISEPSQDSKLERYCRILKQWLPTFITFFVTRLNYPDDETIAMEWPETPPEGSFLSYPEIEKLRVLMPGQDSVASARSWNLLAEAEIPIKKSLVSCSVLSSSEVCEKKYPTEGRLEDYFKSILETGLADNTWQQHEFDILNARLGSLQGHWYYSIPVNTGKGKDIIHTINAPGYFSSRTDWKQLKRVLEGKYSVD